MIKIFAKRGTNEKIAISVPNQMCGMIMEEMKLKDNGEWIFVEQLYFGEALHYVDGMIYDGYNSKIDRYTDSIIKVI